MKLEEALRIVIELANQNALDWDPELDDPSLEGEAKRQEEAIKKCETLSAMVSSEGFKNL